MKKIWRKKINISQQCMNKIIPNDTQPGEIEGERDQIYNDQIEGQNDTEIFDSDHDVEVTIEYAVSIQSDSKTLGFKIVRIEKILCSSMFPLHMSDLDYTNKVGFYEINYQAKTILFTNDEDQRYGQLIYKKR